METAKAKINSAVAKGAETSEYVKAYLNYQVELKKLEASEKSAKALTGVIQGAVLAFLGVTIGLFGLIALAFYLAQKTDLSTAGGFLVIAGAFLVLLLLFLLLKNMLVKKPIEEKIEQSIFKDGLPTDSEEELRVKIKRLERIIETSAKEVPEKMKKLGAEDFIPEKVKDNKVVNTASRVINETKKTPMYLKAATAFISGFIDELRSKDDDGAMIVKEDPNTQEFKEVK